MIFVSRSVSDKISKILLNVLIYIIQFTNMQKGVWVK